MGLHLLENRSRSSSNVYIRFKDVVVLFLVLHRVFKSMESLSFDSPEETDLVRMFPTTANVSVFTPAKNRGMVVGVIGVKLMGAQGTRTFDITGSLDYPPRQVVYHRSFHPGGLLTISLWGIGRLSDPTHFLNFYFSVFSCFSFSTILAI